MTDPNYINPSTTFGQEDGLFVYNMARSLDGVSKRPDEEPIMKLAEDAVRTAVRFRSEEGFPTDDIDIDIATLGLIAILAGDFEDQI
jgi:hypothetical protein